MADWTQTDVNTLRTAVAQGILTVKYSGPPERLVTYASLQAMRALLAEMVADVKDAAGARVSYRFASTRKGLT